MKDHFPGESRLFPTCVLCHLHSEAGPWSWGPIKPLGGLSLPAPGCYSVSSDVGPLESRACDREVGTSADTVAPSDWLGCCRSIFTSRLHWASQPGSWSSNTAPEASTPQVGGVSTKTSLGCKGFEPDSSCVKQNRIFHLQELNCPGCGLLQAWLDPGSSGRSCVALFSIWVHLTPSRSLGQGWPRGS